LNLRGKKWHEAGEDCIMRSFINLYVSPNIIRVNKSMRLRQAGHAACMREMKNAYSILVEKPEGKRPLGRPRHRWEDNIRMDLREI